MVLVENITMVHDPIDDKTASFIEVSPRECFLEFSPVYSTTSSFVSFFLPSFVMLIIYFHLYSIARRHSNSMKASVNPASKYLRRLSRPSLVSSVRSSQQKCTTPKEQVIYNRNNKTGTEQLSSSNNNKNHRVTCNGRDLIEAQNTGHTRVKTKNNLNKRSGEYSLSPESSQLSENAIETHTLLTSKTNHNVGPIVQPSTVKVVSAENENVSEPQKKPANTGSKNNKRIQVIFFQSPMGNELFNFVINLI